MDKVGLVYAARDTPAARRGHNPTSAMGRLLPVRAAQWRAGRKWAETGQQLAPPVKSNSGAGPELLLDLSGPHARHDFFRSFKTYLYLTFSDR